jgi:hypothetical protein
MLAEKYLGVCADKKYDRTICLLLDFTSFALGSKKAKRQQKGECQRGFSLPHSPMRLVTMPKKICAAGRRLAGDCIWPRVIASTSLTLAHPLFCSPLLGNTPCKCANQPCKRHLVQFGRMGAVNARVPCHMGLSGAETGLQLW